jgi:RNA polymerase sigma-70 factor, ECF subfamily
MVGLLHRETVPAREQPADERDLLLGRLASAAGRRGYAIARDLLRDPDEAEDAVQEALARACASLDRLRDPAAAEAWFCRIVTNVCLRTLRRRRLRRVLFGDGTGPEPVAPAPDASRGDVARLMQALDRLPGKQKAALVLRFGHELSIPEVAGLLGVKPATAKTHVERGLQRLRSLLEESP